MLHAPPPPGAVLFRPSATASTPRQYATRRPAKLAAPPAGPPLSQALHWLNADALDHLVKRIPDLSDALSHGTTSSACLNSQAFQYELKA